MTAMQRTKMRMTGWRQRTSWTFAQFWRSLGNTCQFGSIPNDPTATGLPQTPHPVAMCSSDWFSLKCHEKRNRLLSRGSWSNKDFGTTVLVYTYFDARVDSHKEPVQLSWLQLLTVKNLLLHILDDVHERILDETYYCI
jgi:hypothetical protein